MSIDTTQGLSGLRASLSQRDVDFLFLYAAGASLERLARDVLGEEGSYMAVCGRAYRYKQRLLMSLGIDPTLPQRITRQQVRELLNGLSEERDPVSAEELQYVQFKNIVHHLQEQIGLGSTPVNPPQSSSSSGSTQKILVLSDLHVPFHNEHLFTQAVRDHSDADVVVLLGDFLDMYSASRFSKSRVLDPMEELRQGAAILEVLASRFKRVVLLEGNHDTRAQRWLQVNRPEISPLLLHPFDYIRYVWSGGEISRRYPNVEFPQHDLHVPGPISPISARHFVVIGDALLGHFERSLKGPARTVHTIALEWLPQWEDILFERGKVNVILQGHVHRLSKVQWGRYTLFECGCVADVMQYTLVDTRYHPPHMGYVVLYQQDGITDINRSQYFVYHRGS